MSPISSPRTRSAPPFPPTFACVRSGTQDAARISVGGELDIATVAELDAALRSAEADAPLVVLDLRQLEFIDLVAGQLLLTADRRIRQAGGRLVVVRGNSEIEWFLMLVGLDRHLELVDRPSELSDRELTDARSGVSATTSEHLVFQ